MVKKELLDNLNHLGFPLMETDEGFDVHRTLADVVESRDTRLWEGFPVLLANAAKVATFHYEQVERCLSHPDHRQELKGLFLMSLALYEELDLNFAWTAEWRRHAAKGDVLAVQEFQRKLAGAQPFEVAGRQFFAQRLKDMFVHYYEKEAAKARGREMKREALSLEYALSQVFSPKQKELFNKKLNGEPLSKTEREYFSRAVKKKVSALANPELHRLAQKLMEY